jgi:amino acid transporter
MAGPSPSDAHRERWRHELAADNAWGSDTPRRLVDLGAAVAVAAAVLDALLTYALLHGSPRLERNPLIESTMRAIGIGPALTLGALLRVAIVAALTFIASRAVRPVVRYLAAATIAGIAAWWCVVVFANAVVVARPWTAG